MNTSIKTILVSAFMSLTFFANAYDATIVVTGGGPLALQNASVTLNGVTVLTDFWGEASFTGLSNGTYQYTVTKPCYSTRIDTVVINNANMFDFTSITPITSFNVAINATSGGPLGISGATVIMNGDTLITDPWGGVLFTGIPNGTYPYSISKACYNTVYDTVVVNCGDEITFDVLTPATYNIAINATGGGPLGISGAMVILNGDTLITDPWGGVLYTGLSNGTYPYSISKPCYVTVYDTVVVNCDDEITFDVLTPATYNIAINATSGGPLGISGAMVILNGDTLITDPWGGVLYTGLSNGTYPYSISKACYTTVYDTVVVNCDDEITFDVMTPGMYNVAINTTGNGPLGVSGATVTINGQTDVTDPWGGVLIIGLPNGTYPFTITKDCYETVYDTLTINCNDTIVFIPMTELVISDSTSVSICKGDTYIFGSQTLTSAGVYTEVFSTALSCDSTVTLTLSIDSVNTDVTKGNGVLTANNANGTYQWIDCATNMAIAGATSQTFTPVTSGSYAVVVTEGGCSDTSDCVAASIGFAENSLPQVSYYPNPVTNQLVIELGENVTHVSATVYSVTGQLVLSQTENATETIKLNFSGLTSGIYIVNLETDNGQKSFRISKQ